MFMNSKDSTFNLVHSLSAPEKAYFKKYLDKKDKHFKKDRILKMFVLFEQAATYEKDVLQLKSKRIGYSNYAKAKHELFRILTQALVDFNKDRIGEYEIFEKLLAAKMFQNRGMIKESLKELESAEKLNEKFSITEIAPYIFIRKNYYSPFAPSYSSYKVEALKSAENKLNTLFDVIQYEQISAENIPIVINIGTVCKTDEERLHFRKVLQQELLSSYTPKSNFGNMMKQHLICFYSYLLNDTQNAYQAACKAITLVAEKIENCDQGTLQNLSIFHYNAIQYAFSTKSERIYEEHFTAINEIKEFINTEFYKKRIHGELIFLELNWTLANKWYSKALGHADKLDSLEEDLFIYNQSVLSEMYMKISLCYFYNNKYANAINRISKFFQNEAIYSLPEEKTLLSLLEILCNIRLENRSLAASLTRSLYRNLKRQNRLFEFEKLLVRFFQELFQTPNNKKERKQLGLKYLLEVQVLREKQIENFFLELFDFETLIAEGIEMHSEKTIS